MSEDLRVTKTWQNIQMTFIRLLEQCRFQDITIKQLIQECQINRSTFYRNYEDKYDLIQKIADELLVQFQKAINPGFIALNGKKENYISYFSPILHFLNRRKRFWKWWRGRRFLLIFLMKCIWFTAMHYLRNFVKTIIFIPTVKRKQSISARSLHLIFSQRWNGGNWKVHRHRRKKFLRWSC